jgi:hypothetical protein
VPEAGRGIAGTDVVVGRWVTVGVSEGGIKVARGLSLPGTEGPDGEGLEGETLW